MYVYIIGGIGCRSESLDQNYLDQNILAKKNRLQQNVKALACRKMCCWPSAQPIAIEKRLSSMKKT